MIDIRLASYIRAFRQTQTNFWMVIQQQDGLTVQSGIQTHDLDQKSDALPQGYLAF